MSGHETKSHAASSLGPAQRWEKGLVTLVKIPLCAVSAVFVWSRGITLVHCQLVHVNVVDLFQDQLKMGTRLADFCKP